MSGAPIPLSQVAINPIMALLYGGAGAGKTVFSTNSQRWRTLLIDIDKGSLSARCNIGFPATGTLGTRLDLVSVKECYTFNDVLEAHSWAASHIRDYDLIVVDTATELHRMVMHEVASAAKIVVPSQREWGIVLNMMDDLARAFKELGVHIIWTAHEMTTVDEFTGMPMARPAFQGSFKEMYARHFSNIIRYVVHNEEVVNAAGQRETQAVRALMCQTSPTAHGKDRSGALDMWEHPNLDAIMDKIIHRVTTARQMAQGEA